MKTGGVTPDNRILTNAEQAAHGAQATPQPPETFIVPHAGFFATGQVRRVGFCYDTLARAAATLLPTGKGLLMNSRSLVAGLLAWPFLLTAALAQAPAPLPVLDDKPSPRVDAGGP